MRNVMAAVTMLAATLPQSVSALECLIPSIQRDYWWHKEQTETYVLALGQFSDLKRLRKARVGDVDVSPAQNYEVWTGRFTGFQASRRAFDQPFATEVALIFPDFSNIGGGSHTAYQVEQMPGKTGLVWLMQVEDGYRATAEICDELIDADPTHVKPALRCLRGGYCPKPD